MKKAILTIGLFTLVLVSTSFASPNNSVLSVSADNTGITIIDENGGQSTGISRKVDNNVDTVQNPIIIIDGAGGQSSGDTRKRD